jgi:4'-phosphopantetheinyl transferase
MQTIEAAAFARSASPPPLDAASVHVWLLAIEHAPDHRAVAAAAHGLLGRLLAHYGGLDHPPVIARTGRGKPYAPALAGIDFNLSHARDHALVAFARGQPVGIDLERIDRKLDAHDLARRFFSKREADALDAMAEATRATAFLRLWTCKEAVLKALGAGISFGLDRVAFDLDAGGCPTAIAEIADEAGEAAGWNVSLLEPATGFLGALAWHGAPRQIRTFTAAADLGGPDA